jgi:hypothetical protein
MKFKILLLLLIVITSSCIVVKYEQEDDIEPQVSVSQKPIVKMSDKMVRSVRGDMIGFLPEGWFFIDVEDKSNDIIATAVNSEYNLSAVFSVIRSNPQIDETIEKEGIFGLARISFTRRERKTSGDVVLASKYQEIQIGNQKFVKYEYTTKNMPESMVKAKSAVFISELGGFYEFSLVPLTVMDNPLPALSEINDIFNSILATIKY